jgi:hypothetical protein
MSGPTVGPDERTDMKILKASLLLMLIASLAACSGSSQTSSEGTTDDTAGTGTVDPSSITADHTSVAAFDSIPASFIETAKTNYRIFYGHTSHGSQIVTGMEILASALYEFTTKAPAGGLQVEEVSGDLGTDGDLGWVDTTRERLNLAGSDINFVMWSWCGGVSTNNAEGIDAYLNAMNGLEQDYPAVTFVYMTGHTDGSGANGTLMTLNQRIRNYCQANGKILFDFADIESYDPDGNYYPDTSDNCGWCSTWCSSHTCPTCADCAHSHCFNCYNKGKAFWWMMARMAGWDGN